ncbi:serine/threonine-protein kinase [Nonomuraea montanisoli]|uniref:serine/threonine-protein kinase n=1 Tax=Nonomuraea montanisoli TaxID=2741721 RepID=UPI0019630AA7|nr:serine/threonine-protein kinase [Nonomuraea montanisoli]
MEWSAPGYTQVKQLGSGGSGRVVLAVHDETGVKVAIKYLSEELRRDPESLARFQSEARLLVTLRDPHIATMWEYVQDHDGAAIVMELVNGVSLRALLRENGTTGPEAALTVLKGSLLGLARAHRLRLVHKDYKPENVIVRDDGVSKLVDFGIAVREGSLSRPEGTPPYMAPELWAGAPASPATDVYAATAVFFECLTGHRPYRSTEPSVLGYQHVYAPIPVQDAPEPVRELIMRGLAKDPADRPRSAEAFVAELEETARAAYGEEWEERGRRRLAGLVALLALLLPVPETPPAQAGTSLARTVFRGGHGLGRTVARAARHNAVRMAAGAGLAVVVAVAAVFVLASRDRLPKPFDVAAAAPSDSPGPAELVSPPATPVGATESAPPSPPPPPSATRPAIVPPTGDAPTTPPTRGRTPTPRPTRTTQRATPPPTTQPPITQPPTTRPPVTITPTPFPPTTRPPVTITPTPFPPTTRPPVTPTPFPPTTRPPVTLTPTPVPPVTVAALALGDLTVSEEAAGATVTVRAGGTAPIGLTATWAVAGDPVHTERLRLVGALSYTRALSHTLAERPCGRTVTLTVATTPAAPGGPRTATLNVPPCPTTVTGLRVSLDMAPSPGDEATARVRVTATGTGDVPVRVRFALNGESVGTRTATLTGRTSYARSFDQGFRTRPCDATVSVAVTAGDEQASARTRVTCPAGVRRVSIARAAVDGRGGAVAVVTVSTLNDRPVRLSVMFSAGGRQHTEQVTLSGDTAYTRTLSHAFGEVPCGARWFVRATTQPRAAGGGDQASGVTPACEPEEEPSGEPSADPPPRPTPSATPSPREEPSGDRPAPGEPR